MFGNITKTQWICIYFRIFFFKLIGFYSINKQETVISIAVQTQANLCLFLLKLTEYSASVVILLSSNPSWIYLSFYYQYAQKNYYQLQILLHFYQTYYHLTIENSTSIKLNNISRIRIHISIKHFHSTQQPQIKNFPMSI